jgi:hypothetical protein
MMWTEVFIFSKNEGEGNSLEKESVYVMENGELQLHTVAAGRLTE